MGKRHDAAEGQSAGLARIGAALLYSRAAGL